LAFMGKVVNVFAIFPQGEALIVVSPVITMTHPMGIAHKQRSNLLLCAEIDHLSRGLMAQITNTPLCATALLVFRLLEFLPAPGIFGAVTLLFGKLTKLLVPLSL